MKKKLVPFITAGLLAAAASGCSKDDFPRYTSLGDLRVLALRANSPEVTPGTSVQLTPLVSDIGGAGRALQYTLEGCADPGVGVGANPSCTGASDRQVLSSGSLSLSAPAYTQALTAITVTVPSTIFNNHSVVEQYNGVAYLVVFTINAPNGGPSVTSFKRLIASNRPVKNTNPALTDLVTSSSVTVASVPSSTVTLYPSITTGSEEIFSVLNGDGTYSNFQERLTTTWFASDGSFDLQRTESTNGNNFSPSSKPSSHSTVLVLVTRDGRGGETWVLKSL